MRIHLVNCEIAQVWSCLSALMKWFLLIPTFLIHLLLHNHPPPSPVKLVLAQMHLNHLSSAAAPRLFFPFLHLPSPLIHFAPPPFVSSSLHLFVQAANLWGCYFLLICRAPLLPISTSERLLLMVPKEENQPWIRTRPLPAFCRCAGHWECHILLSPRVSAKVQLQSNVYEMEIQSMHLAFIVSQELSDWLNTQQLYVLIPKDAVCSACNQKVLVHEHYIVVINNDLYYWLFNRPSYCFTLRHTIISTRAAVCVSRPLKTLPIFIRDNEQAAQFMMMGSHSLELLRIAWLFYWEKCMEGERHSICYT